MKTALVTGANRGIGRAIAAGLAAQGIQVRVGARNLADAVRVADEIGGEAVEIDLERAETFSAADGVDILVNNAGVLGQGPFLTDPDGFAQHMQVMLHGPYALIARAVPGMQVRGYGRIVNLSSGWGSFAEGLDGPHAYGVAKAALNALTLALSRELPACVKINAMCPGWVHTRMGGEAAPRSPEEGADTALWLATLPESGPTGGFFRDRAPIDW
ncbi:NAD(P)-dependent dehydrogenase (short-subunit alcohol dehydrogenase family) [Rubricella aquisinus]|uniref:NAD(P)-dependent dehydrogenase (Short-subunit alcohol dehydrogenase family) n=1 Tax=Rubricella aquisinus TaxID=2028108 RepID=A0A840WLE5_9RHOB|nr:SDR family NAD(P)-dependent oxidoreductase [Rubricella aquisinus]MBB5515351.1 NAD(P)-dependent dehydrogenase (short-subunit alcohol dehydrogenase family) [Rubricella aquisinus]